MAGLIALLAGAWLAVALWFTIAGARRSAAARAVIDEHGRLGALIEAGPAAPLLVAPDGAISGSGRLAGALGLTELPPRWLALFGDDKPFPAEAAAPLGRVLAEAAAGGRSSLTVRPAGSARIFRVDGSPAPPGFGERSAVLWFVDVTASEEEKARLTAQLERRSEALDALSVLIEAAPFPMWHRGPDLRMVMVNGAYVDAVEGENAASVVAEGTELIDEAEGRSPLADAAWVRDRQEASFRTVPATVAGERRMMQVVEIPLGPNGVAGYAIDVEDQERARSDLDRFVRAQRDMLDRLSAGVAQFGRDRSLIFFNEPFAQMFALPADFLGDRPEFDRVIEAMREAGNLPEVRDFPDWKEAHRAWFTSGLEAEELAKHPRVDALAPHLAGKLKRASHAGLVRELVRSATVERKQRGGRVSMLDGREFEFAAVPLPDGNALFTMLDISDSRKVESALRDRNEALEEADRLKTAFVSNMSYELRTPLTSIAGFAEMLSAGYAGDLPSVASEYVTAIMDSVVRLGALIDNVLDLTQSETGG